jgi:hypothetical protein
LTRVDKELTVLLKRAEWKDCEKWLSIVMQVGYISASLLNPVCLLVLGLCLDYLSLINWCMIITTWRGSLYVVVLRHLIKTVDRRYSKTSSTPALIKPPHHHLSPGMPLPALHLSLAANFSRLTSPPGRQECVASRNARSVASPVKWILLMWE